MIILFVGAGGEESPEVRKLLEEQLSSQDQTGMEAMTVFAPRGEHFEVGEGYTQIYIPDGVKWQWELSSKNCAYRLRQHWALWNMGWRLVLHLTYCIAALSVKANQCCHSLVILIIFPIFIIRERK